MARDDVELVTQYPTLLQGPKREPFIARAYMRHPRGELWEGWLAFLSLRTGAVVETERETTQGRREHLLYWASGLEPTYLRGALERALRRRADLKRGRPATTAERRAWRALIAASVDAGFRRVRIGGSHRRARRRRRARSVKVAALRSWTVISGIGG